MGGGGCFCLCLVGWFLLFYTLFVRVVCVFKHAKFTIGSKIDLVFDDISKLV